MIVLGRAILIKPDILPARTKSGSLIIPQNSKELLPEWGTVVGVGPACKQVKEGDRINFPRKIASVIVIDDQDYYFIPEHKTFYHE